MEELEYGTTRTLPGSDYYYDYSDDDLNSSSFIPPVRVIDNQTYCYDPEQRAYTWCQAGENAYAVPLCELP